MHGNRGRGRPLGSKNVAPDRKRLVTILDTIVQNLEEKVETLTTAEKIKILTAFRHLYTNELTEEQIEAFKEITIQIIGNNGKTND